MCRFYLSLRPVNNKIEPCQRVLIVTYDAIGDMVMTTPVLEHLSLIFSDSKIDVLCSHRNAAIIRHCDYISELFALDLNSGKSFNEWRTLAKLRKRRYQRVINLFDEADALALAKISSISTAVDSLPIIYKNRRQQKTLGYIGGHFRFSGENTPPNFTSRIFGILHHFKLSIPESFTYRVCIPDKLEYEIVKKLGLHNGGGILFNPVGSRRENSLSEKMTYNLLTALLKQYFRVMVFPYGLMANVLKKHTDLVSNERLAIIHDQGILDVAVTVKHAAEVLTTDTALVHLAIACERPVTIIKSRSEWDTLFDPPYGDYSIVPAVCNNFLSGFKVDEVIKKLRWQDKESTAGKIDE